MRLRDWRKDRGLTLQQVAPVIGMPVSSLSDLEKGKTTGLTWEAATKVEAITKGEVGLADLFDDWRKSPANSDLYHSLRGQMKEAAKGLRAKK